MLALWFGTMIEEAESNLGLTQEIRSSAIQYTDDLPEPVLPHIPIFSLWFYQMHCKSHDINGRLGNVQYWAKHPSVPNLARVGSASSIVCNDISKRAAVSTRHVPKFDATRGRPVYRCSTRNLCGRFRLKLDIVWHTFDADYILLNVTCRTDEPILMKTGHSSVEAW